MKKQKSLSILGTVQIDGKVLGRVGIGLERLDLLDLRFETEDGAGGLDVEEKEDGRPDVDFIMPRLGEESDAKENEGK